VPYYRDRRVKPGDDGVWDSRARVATACGKIHYPAAPEIFSDAAEPRHM
jgi:hypothetical protein